MFLILFNLGDRFEKRVHKQQERKTSKEILITIGVDIHSMVGSIRKMKITQLRRCIVEE